MRILNRVIAAGALVVPLALVASGVAVAEVAADSSVLPTQIRASEDDSSEGCYPGGVPMIEGDGFAEGLLNDFLGIGEDERFTKCGKDDSYQQG